MNTDLPKPGEYWHRSDGSLNGVTIISVEKSALSDLPDPWVTYEYVNGEVHEKNLLAFKCRFHRKEVR